MKNSLDFLSTRAGFNVSLRHFKFVNKIIKKIENSENLADVINDALENKMVEQYQFSSILNALLVDKYGYSTKSFNMKKNYAGNLTELAKQFSDWERFDLILSYFHPQLGEILINPKKETSWESCDMLKENELVVVYVGNFNNSFDTELAKKAALAIKLIINGEKSPNTKLFKEKSEETATVTQNVQVKQDVVIKQEKKQEQVVQQKQQITQPTQTVTQTSGLKKKLSPKRGILVANELFHNGNVEAWKRIIASYENKYPDTKVIVFYDGEQIQDLNTLFKWGKVKHGTMIEVALLGPEFRDVSKLGRYLTQGASNRFEDFLKGDPTKLLALF